MVHIMSVANLEHPNNSNLHCGSLFATNINSRNFSTVYGNTTVSSMGTVWQKGIATEQFNVIPNILSDVNLINMGYVGSSNFYGFSVGSIYFVTLSYTCVPSNGSSVLEVQFTLGATTIRRTIGTVDASDCNGRLTFEFTVTSYNPSNGAYAIVWTWSNAFAKGTTVVDSGFELGGSAFSTNLTGINHIMPFGIGVRFAGSSDTIQFGRIMCLVRQLA